MYTKFRQGIQLSAILLFSLLSIQSEAQVKSYTREYNDLNFTVVEVDDLAKLRLFLNQQERKTSINYFTNIPLQLTQCEVMRFAMNAGMFHSNFNPVGLYLEKRQTQYSLNRHRGWGNFYLKPNGVLAWNSKQAIILSSSQYTKKKFNADYATQSGPMLVLNRQINPIFLPQGKSLKQRNAVGLKNQRLYFVITQQPVNFYTLASFMQNQLKLEQALYLDGSISAIYLAENQVNTQSHSFGPMFAYIEDQSCS